MQLEEAQKIALLIGFADSGCSNCVDDLVDHANRIFPEFTWTMSRDRAAHRLTHINEDGIECTNRFIPVSVEPRHAS